MIKAKFFRNTNNDLYGIKVVNHGPSLVCAAVSTIVINTLNSIEILTKYKVIQSYNVNGGYLSFYIEQLKKNEQAPEALLLLKSLFIGLKSLEKEHKEHITIIDKVVK